MSKRIDGGTDIDYVRMLLDEVGIVEYRTEITEPLTTVSANKVFLDYSNIDDIIGVWGADDITMSGTDYYSSGSSGFHQKQSYVILDPPVAKGGTEVIVSYTHRKGMSDDEITLAINISKSGINGKLLRLGDPIDFSGTEAFEEFALQIVYLEAAYRCLLNLNSGNVTQAGFSYGSFGYDVQTKLWGEGMSTGELLRMMRDQIDGLIKSLEFADGKIAYVNNLAYGMPQYNYFAELPDYYFVSTTYIGVMDAIQQYLDWFNSGGSS